MPISVGVGRGKHSRGNGLLSRALYEVGANPAGPQGKRVSECVASVAQLPPVWVRGELTGQEKLGRGVTGCLKQAAHTGGPSKTSFGEWQHKSFLCSSARLPPQIDFQHYVYFYHL